MTQCERIVEYMQMFGSISPLEAFRDLGITKLATRISEMRKTGMTFEQEYVKSKNRFGEDVYFMRYYLPKKGDKQDE